MNFETFKNIVNPYLKLKQLYSTTINNNNINVTLLRESLDDIEEFIVKLFITDKNKHIFEKNLNNTEFSMDYYYECLDMLDDTEESQKQVYNQFKKMVTVKWSEVTSE